MAKVKRVPQVVPTPPDKVVIELSMEEAAGLHTLLCTGVTSQVLSDLKLFELDNQLHQAAIVPRGYNFRYYATKRE